MTAGTFFNRCIGEKMARAMICVFLGVVLPELEARAPPTLPSDNFFDLVTAAKLELLDLRRRELKDRP